MSSLKLSPEAKHRAYDTLGYRYPLNMKGASQRVRDYLNKKIIENSCTFARWADDGYTVYICYMRMGTEPAQLRQENYTFVKWWEDKARKGGLKNILWTVSYDFANGIYVFIRAMIGAQDRTLAGRGMNPTEKAEAGLSGFTTIGTWIVPISILPKGIKSTTGFQKYSKITKGRYKDMVSRWKGYKTDKGNVIMVNEAEVSEKVIEATLPEIKRQIDEINDTLK